jgi:hypothetical protein
MDSEANENYLAMMRERDKNGHPGNPVISTITDGLMHHSSDAARTLWMMMMGAMIGTTGAPLEGATAAGEGIAGGASSAVPSY